MGITVLLGAGVPGWESENKPETKAQDHFSQRPNYKKKPEQGNRLSKNLCPYEGLKAPGSLFFGGAPTTKTL